jgi:DNA-binding response OmpR family regulator
MAKIMIVDDERLVRWSISNGLKRDNHEVFCAQDAEQAVEKVKKISFDLVITDFKMPGMNGAELLEHLKQLSPKTKVMMLTAYSAELSRKKAIELGACEYIEKPFVIDEIRSLVQSLVKNCSLIF